MTYMTNARHIIENLKLDNEISNLSLIEKINDGQITPQILANLKPEEMHSERWMELIEKKTLEMDNLTDRIND